MIKQLQLSKVALNKATIKDRSEISGILDLKLPTRTSVSSNATRT